jgi:serine/threonine protein kinase
MSGTKTSEDLEAGSSLLCGNFTTTNQEILLLRFIVCKMFAITTVATMSGKGGDTLTSFLDDDELELSTTLPGGSDDTAKSRTNTVGVTPCTTSKMSRSPSGASLLTCMAELRLSPPADPYSLAREDIRKLQRIGKGSFGTVFRGAYTVGVRDVRNVAIKVVVRDPRYENREVPILKLLAQHRHPALVDFLGSYVSTEVDQEGAESTLDNVVMEYLPSSLDEFFRARLKTDGEFRFDLAFLIVHRLAEGLRHMHNLGICHRDLKLHNVLVDPDTMAVKICDFGSAKILPAGKAGVTYISSRYYRAPELILEQQRYSLAIDAWALGCIFAELLRGLALFVGKDNVEVLSKQFRIRGTPNLDELNILSPTFQTSLPFAAESKPIPWIQVLERPTPAEKWKQTTESVYAILDGLLAWLPNRRLEYLSTMPVIT